MNASRAMLDARIRAAHEAVEQAQRACRKTVETVQAECGHEVVGEFQGPSFKGTYVDGHYCHMRVCMRCGRYEDWLRGSSRDRVLGDQEERVLTRIDFNTVMQVREWEPDPGVDAEEEVA